jgi:hypothetical protein
MLQIKRAIIWHQRKYVVLLNYMLFNVKLLKLIVLIFGMGVILFSIYVAPLKLSNPPKCRNHVLVRTIALLLSYTTKTSLFTANNKDSCKHF